MQSTSAESIESIELERRDVRALTEYMTTLPLGGDVYSVTTQSGSEYRVDVREDRCTCPDKQYDLEDGQLCKHIRRVAFATGERPIPAWVNTDEIDTQLGQHVEETPRVVMTDGGVTLASFAGEDNDEEGCWCDDHGMPCFDCYRTGRRRLPGEGQ